MLRPPGGTAYRDAAVPLCCFASLHEPGQGRSQGLSVIASRALHTVLRCPVVAHCYACPNHDLHDLARCSLTASHLASPYPAVPYDAVRRASRASYRCACPGRCCAWSLRPWRSTSCTSLQGTTVYGASTPAPPVRQRHRAAMCGAGLRAAWHCRCHSHGALDQRIHGTAHRETGTQ